jgi:hypothetical protein
VKISTWPGHPAKTGFGYALFKAMWRICFLKAFYANGSIRISRSSVGMFSGTNQFPILHIPAEADASFHPILI